MVQLIAIYCMLKHSVNKVLNMELNIQNRYCWAKCVFT